MKMLSKFYEKFRNILLGFYRLYLFIKDNRKIISCILIFYAGMLAGEYRELLQTFLGRNFDSNKVGQNVRISGDCLFYNGSRVTLGGDQLRIIKKDKERIYGVVIGLSKSVSCLRQNVVVEPYTYAQFLVDNDRPIVKLDDKRIVEVDPELALVKKTVLISGVCRDADTNKNRNLNANLAEILSVEGDFDRILNIFLVVQSKTLRCDSKLVKTRLVKDEDVSTFAEDERLRQLPKGPEKLEGKIVEVSGNCSLVNPATKKEAIVHLRGQPVLVLGEQKDGDIVMAIRGSTAYQNYDAIPITCDKNKEPDIYWELSDGAINSANSEPKKTQKILITGNCLLDDGSKHPLFEQEVRVSEMTKSDGVNIDKVVGFIKIQSNVKKVICDKKDEKSLQFDTK